MRTTLLWISVLVTAGLMLSRLKDGYLRATYHHDRNGLVRVEGRPGELSGIWEGTFDAYPCGFDSRLHVRLTLGDDGYGHLDYRFYTERIGGHSTMAYSWGSLLPWDEAQVQRESWTARARDGALLLMRPPPTSKEASAAEFAAYELHGDSLYFAYVTKPGDRPTHWGL